MLFAIAAGPASYADFDHTHSQWEKVLKEFVVLKNPGVTEVRYGDLKKNPSILGAYLKELESVTLSDFKNFSKDEQLSLLINAYNAFTVKLILDHYPVKSIKEIGGWFSNPWKKEFFTLMGAKRTLDDIEHGMIRQDAEALKNLGSNLVSVLKKFNEPRIHFAVNCASKGCPALGNRPYFLSELTKQLEDATQNFLNNRDQNRFDSAQGTLFLSSIFKWYGSDFEPSFGSIKAFVAPYIAKNKDDEKKILKATVEYLDYDWSLNGK